MEQSSPRVSAGSCQSAYKTGRQVGHCIVHQAVLLSNQRRPRQVSWSAEATPTRCPRSGQAKNAPAAQESVTPRPAHVAAHPTRVQVLYVNLARRLARHKRPAAGPGVRTPGRPRAYRQSNLNVCLHTCMMTQAAASTKSEGAHTAERWVTHRHTKRASLQDTSDTTHRPHSR